MDDRLRRVAIGAIGSAIGSAVELIGIEETRKIVGEYSSKNDVWIVFEEALKEPAILNGRIQDALHELLRKGKKA